GRTAHGSGARDCEGHADPVRRDPRARSAPAGRGCRRRRAAGAREGGRVNRIEQIQQALGEAGADGLVLRLAENVVLATGYWPQIGGLGIVVVPGEGEASLLVPEYEEPEVRMRWTGDVQLFPAIRFDGETAGAAIERLLRELAHTHGLEGKPIGFEGSFDSVAPPRLDGEPNAVSGATQGLLRSTFATDRLVYVTPQLEWLRR